MLFHPRFVVKGHSHFRLYDLLIDWYDRVIFRHFSVEIGTVVLPMIYGCRHSPPDLLCCSGLPYIVIVVVFFTFGVWCKLLSRTDCLGSFSHVVSYAH